jgi:hypothetical protein
MIKDSKNLPKKAPVIMVFNSKGGGGKSTCAQQVLATYILSRHGFATIKELDDQNLDSAYLDRSKITADQILLGEDVNEFASAVSGSLPLKAEGLVVDVGGNRTTNIVIRELSRLTTRARLIDAICIPISDNRMGVRNAEKTLEEIKDSPEGKELISKCFIALNRVRNKNAKSIDDPSILRRFRQAVKLAKSWNLQVMFVHDMDGIENLAPLGKTVMEVAEMRDELIEDLNTQILKADEEGRDDDVVLLDDLQWAVNVATHDFAPLITNSHKQLDSILKKLN